jgi:aldose 1-epimerase
MYQYHIEAFGRFERHVFSKGNQRFSIVPEHGAVLLDAHLNGTNVIEGFTTPEALEDLKWGKSICLYPFPNRMCDGQYTHEGKTYNFPIDNPATNNAIHGFGKKMPHPIVKMTLAEHYAQVTCRNDYDGHLPYYPFACSFEITFTLDDHEGMSVRMSFTNHSETAIPAGIGWHPYFSISEKIEDTVLELDALQFISIDDRMLPTGEKIPYQVFENATKINDVSLDNGFFIPSGKEKFYATLLSEKGKLTYWQTTGERKYNFIQIFTPPHRTCIALEPMTCNVNAFNNKDGLVILDKGESLFGDFGFSFI